MAQNYSNLVPLNTNQSLTTPASSALSNKISPSILKPLAGGFGGTGTSFTPKLATGQQVTKQTVTPDGTVTHNFSTADTGTGQSSTPVTPTTPTPTSGGIPVVTGTFAPGTPQNLGTATTTTPQNQTTTAPTTPQQSPVSPSSTAGLINGLTGIGTNGSAGYTKAVNNLLNFNQSLAGKNAAIESEPIPLNFQQGKEQVLNRLAAQEQANLQAAVTQEQTQQGQQIGALEGAGALGTQTVQTPYGTPVYSFANGGNLGTTGGSGPISGAEIQSNIGSAGTIQSNLNTIQAAVPAATAALGILNSYAKGIGTDTPILSGLQQLYGNTVQGSQAVAGFQAQLQAVRAAWTAIEGGDATSAIPDNVTPAQITQIQTQLQNDATNKIAGYTNQLKSISTQTNSLTGNNTTPSTTTPATPMFGNFNG